MRTTYDVRDKTVFITGAARGIGAALAERMIERGAYVALVGLEPERLQQRAEELGERAAWFTADVTEGEQLQAAVDGTVRAFGGIDVVVANAGLSFIGSVQDQSSDEWIRTIDVNLLGVYRTNVVTLPHVVQRGGYVLNIASLAAVAHAPLMSAYAASKAGVEAMTDALRVELAITEARAGCGYFGFVDTDLVRGAYEHPATQAANRLQPSFLKTPIPLSAAIDAIDHGIQRRAKPLWAPWWVGTAIALRSLVTPLAEAALTARRGELAESIRLAHPRHSASAPPIDPELGVAVQEGHGALEHGSARDLV